MLKRGFLGYRQLKPSLLLKNIHWTYCKPGGTYRILSFNAGIRLKQNFLKAVFWDYPNFQNAETIRLAVQKARRNNDTLTLNWILGRFLERGRVRDVALFFNLREINDSLEALRLSKYANRKWRRLLEVYENVD